MLNAVGVRLTAACGVPRAIAWSCSCALAFPWLRVLAKLSRLSADRRGARQVNSVGCMQATRRGRRLVRAEVTAGVGRALAKAGQEMWEQAVMPRGEEGARGLPRRGRLGDRGRERETTATTEGKRKDLKTPEW